MGEDSPESGMVRRAVLVGAALAMAAPRTVLARDADFSFAAPPWSNYRSVERRQAEAERLLTPPEVDAVTGWRDDMDRAHLAGIEAAAALLDRPADDPLRQFQLTPDGLAALLSANVMSPIEARDRMDQTLVLFALRGCTVVDPGEVGRPLETATLAVAELDHLTPRCVLGVWRRADSRIAVFPGSTVPNRHAMAMQAAAFARAEGHRPVWRIANVLPTGRYDFTVGAHGGWQPAALRSADLAGRATIQPALRSSSGRLAWRDLRLDVGVVLDNIHPAMTPADSRGAAFSSEGCLTLAEREPPPRWSPRPPDWQTFSQLAEVRRVGRGQRRSHSLALLTGIEAWLAAQGTAAPRLRYRSKGPEVAALRRTMGLPGGDVFDAEMLRRWMTAGEGAAPVAFPEGDARFVTKTVSAG